MIVYDKYSFNTSREIDPNGFLRVEMSNITKAQIRPYLGREIPSYKDFNLDPNKIYNVLCPKEELEKAAKTFNNLPLTSEHIEVDVDDVPKEKIVGSLGDHASFDGTYLKNNLIVYDKKDIDKIMSGKKKELSCGYRYTPVRESGEYEGQHYDFKMTDIIGNHVALVKQGRAGRDVMVADTSKSILETIKEKVMAVFDKDLIEEKEEVIEDKESNKKQEKVGVVMKEFKEGELKSGSGEKVTDPKQAIAIALSEADKVAKDEIPEKAGKPEKAGEENALQQGEKKMAEEVKEEVKTEKKVETTPAEEKPVEDACSKDEEIKKKKESEEEVVEDEKEKDLKGKKQEAFAEGVKYGEKKEKEEPKKLDSEHESEGAKKADKEEKEEKEEKKEMAKDSDLVMDADALRAEGREQAMADFKARDCARKSVRSIVGDVDIFAFDSAEDIYKFACKEAGMNLDEIVNFKDAFAGLQAGKAKLALDASPVSGSNEECFKNIRIA